VAQTVAGATLVLMIMNMMARLLGFVRETAVAAIYGATAFTDAYQVAYTLPYFLQMVLGMALVSSIVPVVVRNINNNQTDEAWKVASITINCTFIIMLVFTGLGMIGSKLLVAVTAPGFAAETAAYAVRMTIIMFPSVVFMSVGMLITGILNARQKFAVAAAAPAFSSLIIIIGVVLFGRRFAYALPAASLISFIGFLLIQIPALKKTGFQYTPSLDWRNPQVKAIFGNLLPIFIGTATYQIYLAINRFFASGLAEGSISALNYAGKLMNLPLGVFVSAVSSAIFPLLAAQALEKDHTQMVKSINRGLKLVLLVTLPAAAGLMALRVPIIQLLFERGAFNHQATLQTAQALLWFGPGMGAMAATQVLTRAYYALGNTKTPLIMGLSSIVINILASSLLMPHMNQGGLALANSLASMFNAIGMYVFLSYHLKDRQSSDLLKTIVKTLLASLATGAAAYLVYNLSATFLNGIQQSLALLFNMCISIGVGVMLYFLVLWLLKENTLWEFVSQLINKRKEG
jgi:putative peptidoglycan lipid II flippase